MEERYILLVAGHAEADGASERTLRGALSERAVVTRRGPDEVLGFLLPERGEPPPLPAVVVLEVVSLRGEALELLTELRRREETRLVPVVVLSASGAPDEVQACYRHGANSYVLEPPDARRREEVVASLGRYWARLNHPPASRSAVQ